MNIGIVVPHLGPSQISFYAIKEINRLVAEKYPHDLVLFFEQLINPVIQPQCASMCINELMSFKGILITTTIDNTTMSIARNTRKDNKIVFYVWDLEWMRPNKNIYLYNYKAFNSVHKLIARSENHKKAIENYANRPIDKIIEDFNIEEILK
jgi:hypothetical protein